MKKPKHNSLLNKEMESIRKPVAEPPRKPLTAFFLFKQDVYEATKKEHPGAMMTDLTKIISERWRNIDHQTHVYYEQKTEAAKLQYQQDFKEYESKYCLFNLSK